MKAKWMVVLVALAISGCEFEEVERITGFKGKARINPWLAAERMVGRYDWEVISSIAWRDPQWEDSMWVVPAGLINNQSFVRQLETWTEDGGNLLILIEHTEPELDDWSEREIPPRIELPLVTMLGEAGIVLRTNSPDGKLRADQVEFLDGEYAVEAASSAGVSTEGGEPGIFASVPFGDGRMTVVTDGRIFRNRWIGEQDHAALFMAVVESGYEEGAIGFMRGSGLSLWSLLREHHWPFLLGATALLLLWLWKHLARFGPIDDSPVLREREGYERHLEAIGDFEWRFDHAAGLLNPLRSQIVETGQRIAGSAGARDRDFFQFLADRAGLPRERVERALAERAPADAAILTRTTADLQTLLKSIR